MKKVRPNIQYSMHATVATGGGVVGEQLSENDNFGNIGSPVFEERERVFLPKKRYMPLTREEIAEMVKEDFDVQTQRKHVDRLAKIVYGDSCRWRRRLAEIEKNPGLGIRLCHQIGTDPRSVSPLRGFELFGIKSPARVSAENHFLLLRQAVENYSYTVTRVGMDIGRRCQGLQERTTVLLNRKVRDLLALSIGEQKEILRRSPEMRGEVITFMQQCNKRLSQGEKRAVSDHDHLTLADSLGVSMRDAQEISDLILAVRDASSFAKYIESRRRRQVTAKTYRYSNVMAMAS